MTEEQLAAAKAANPAIQRANNYGLAKTLEDIKMASIAVQEFPDDALRAVVLEDRMIATRYGSLIYHVGKVLDDPSEIARAQEAEVPLRIVSQKRESKKSK